ncbi:putative ubiquitin ligase E3 [Ixodes scapularis]
MSHDARTRWKHLSSQYSLESAGAVLGQIVDHLEHSPLYLDDDDIDAKHRCQEWSESELEQRLKEMTTPFLRMAALTQAHLYDEQLPLVTDPEGEYESVCHFLGLTGREGAQQGQSGLATSCLSWATSEPHILLRTWCQDYGNFVGKSPIAARSLVECRWRWAQPRLLLLPGRYDQLFQYYHSRACRLCHSVPKDPSVCLVCGTLVCLRENCCRQQAYYEAVHHSINCGAGTAIFLAVNSSTIIVIRGKRACLWGSVYLDSFGEEDRDLKRGKPLYLSVERYQLLQEQWTTHAFDHTSKRWVWHKDNL